MKGINKFFVYHPFLFVPLRDRYRESEPVMLTNKMQAASGYIKFVDDEGNATVNSENIYLSDK